MATGKRSVVKVFNNREVQVANIVDANIGSFEWTLNGGLGQLTFEVTRPIDDFSERTVIYPGHKVQIYIFDAEATSSGKLIYQGFIESYTATAAPNRQQVKVRCVGYQSILAFRLHKSGSATTVTHTSTEIAQIVKEALNGVTDVVSWSNGTIENTGVSVTYTFRNNSIKEVLDKCVELAPDGFYWYVDPSNVVHFAKVNTTKVDHKATYGRDFNQLEMEKTIDSLTNRIFFVGGGSPNLFTKTDRSDSQTEFGLREVRVTDQRVTTSDTASKLVSSKLDQLDHPTVRIRIGLIDSNYTNSSVAGVDIERYKPGDIIVLNSLGESGETLWDSAFWDIDYWDYDFISALGTPLIITRLSYQFNQISLELGDFQQTFGRDYVALTERLSTGEYQDLPSTPS